MIVDTIEHWNMYHYGAGWGKAFEFLSSLTPEIQDGEYPLQADALFARIMTYSTRTPEEAVLEAHRVHVDIQMVLKGREAVEWFPAENLAVKTPYDSSKDAEFFLTKVPGPVRLVLTPGLFTVFFPHDAHMPSLISNDRPEVVKKVVVKIKKDIMFTG